MVSHVEQEVFTLPEQLSSTLVVNEFRVVRSLFSPVVLLFLWNNSRLQIHIEAMVYYFKPIFMNN
jgi:hypothetical protein